MIENFDFKQLFYNTINDCIGGNTVRFSDIEPLYSDLKTLDNAKLIQIIKLIIFIKIEMQNNSKVIHTPNYFDTKLISDTTALIKANQTNVKFLGYSPLIGNIFRYYLYINKFKKTKKFQDLEKKLYIEWNSMYKYNFHDEDVNKSVLFFFRLYLKLDKAEPYKKLYEINLKDQNIQKLKNSIESIYTRKLHADTFYKLFIKILVEKQITNEALANKILQQIFNYPIYLDSSKFKEKEVIYIFNRLTYLKRFTGIN